MKSISIPQIQTIDRFFTWWGGELSSLLPAVFKQRFQGYSTQYQVHVNPQKISILNTREGSESVLFEGVPTTKQITTAKSRIKNLKLHPGAVCAIGIDNILFKTIDLPKSAEGPFLRNIVQNQLQKITPFKAEEIHFDVRPLPSRSTDKTITLELALIHKKDLAAYLDLCSAIGLTPASLRYSDGKDRDARPFDFNLGKTSRSKSKWSSVFKKILGVVCLLLIGTALALPLLKQGKTIEALSASVNVQKQQLTLKTQKVAALKDLSQTYNFAMDKKSAHPSAIVVLNELSNILPAHSWIFHYQAKGSTIEIQGYSSNTPDIITVIENNQFFKDVRQQGGIIRKTGSAKERFHLKFTLIQPSFTGGKG